MALFIRNHSRIENPLTFATQLSIIVSKIYFMYIHKALTYTHSSQDQIFISVVTFTRIVCTVFKLNFVLLVIVDLFIIDRLRERKESNQRHARISAHTE